MIVTHRRQRLVESERLSTGREGVGGVVEEVGGGVAVDALDRAQVGAPAGWVDEIAALPDGERAGQTLWFHSRTPHRSGPNRSGRPRRALYPTYNAASEGDLRAAYYDAKRAAFAPAPAPAPVGDRARVSLINDFEGRPV